MVHTESQDSRSAGNSSKRLPVGKKIATWKKELQESWSGSSPACMRYPTRRSAAQIRPELTKDILSTDQITRHPVNSSSTRNPANTDMADGRNAKAPPSSHAAIRTVRSPTPDAPSTPVLIEGLLSFFEERETLYRQYKTRIEPLLRAQNTHRTDVDQNPPGSSRK